MRGPASISYPVLLGKAGPIVLANATVPLLGLADTAVIGNAGSVEDLGAVAFGTLIFSFVYWGFAFLRMGTTGFIALAKGAGNEAEVRVVLGRALLIAVALGALLILLQWPIRVGALALLGGSDTVERIAADYFHIRIWGAPAALSLFALTGLLIGLGNSRQLLLVQVFLNGLNVLLDVVFAGLLGWGASGIALGTVLAEWSALAFAGWLIRRELARGKKPGQAFWPLSAILDRNKLLRTFSANAHLMIRTLLLVFTFAFLADQSARFGDAVLAANHLLLQLIAFAAFFLDGYAFVTESLVGQAAGAGRRDRFDVAVARCTILALATALVLAALLLLFGEASVVLLTDLAPVRSAANTLLPLAALYVSLSFGAFQLDGIFIGVSRTRELHHAAWHSLFAFLLAWWLLIDGWGVVGLWWAMIVHVLARSLALLRYYSALRASIGPGRAA